MLLQSAIRHNDQTEFKFWFLYFIFVTWIMMVAYWLHRLDWGLALFPPLFIIPVMQVFFVFFAIVCGGIYFNEFDSFDEGQWIGFIIGVSMILGGVYGLAPTHVVLQTPTTQVAPSPRDNEKEIEKEKEKEKETQNQSEESKFLNLSSNAHVNHLSAEDLEEGCNTDVSHAQSSNTTIEPFTCEPVE
jgi:hypothetical protein